MLLSEFRKNYAARLFISLILIIIISGISYLFFDILVMISIAVLIAFIFSPAVGFLERHGVSRIFAVLIVFAASGALIFFGISSFLPKIASQLNRLAESLNEEKALIFINHLQTAIEKYIPFLHNIDLAGQIGNFIRDTFYNSLNNFNQILSSIFSFITILVIVPFMSFFLLKDDKKIIKGMLSILPNKYFEMSYYILKQMIYQLGRFVRGWLLDALFVGVMSILGLTLLGIDNAVSIGAIAGIGHLIPYFGPVIGGLPALIISVIQFGDFSMLPSIFLMFVIIYSVDNGFIQPNVFSKATDIHPILIIILILIGSQLMGITGMLLAVPVSTVIKTAAKEIYLGYKSYNILKK